MSDKISYQDFCSKLPDDIRADQQRLLNVCRAANVDVPLLEIVLTFGIIQFLVLIEAAVVIALLIKQMKHSKEQSELLIKLSNTLLEVKKLELQELDKMKKR